MIWIFPAILLAYTWFTGGVDPVQNRTLLWVLAIFGLFGAAATLHSARPKKGWISFNQLMAIAVSTGTLYVLIQGGMPFNVYWSVIAVVAGQIAYTLAKANAPTPQILGATNTTPVAESRLHATPEYSAPAPSQPQARLFPAMRTRLSFSDVVGMDELKSRLLEAGQNIVGYMNGKGDLTPRNGILLSGKPGNGKTFFAEALAGELRLPMVKLTYGDAASRWINQTTEQVIAAFRDAADQAPCVLFIDEVDSFLVDRSKLASTDSETGRSTNTILTEITKLQGKKVVLIAATNFRDQLDPASIREGRFDFKIEITPPDLTARKALFTQELKRRYRQAQPDEAALDTAAKRWDGFSVARVRAIAQQVAQDAEKLEQKKVDYALIRKSLRTVQGQAGDKIIDSIPAVSDLSMNLETKEQLLGLVRRMEEIAEIEALGGTVPKGVLFYGPPGTGKTFAVQSLAKTAGWALLSTSGHDLLANPARIDELVEKAADIRPCIVFIDEADDALQDRRSSLNGHITAKVLTALDGSTSTSPDVMFVAATNFPDVIDDAAMRGGRLGEKIKFAPPDRSTLVNYAQAWREKLKVKLADNVSIEWLATMLEGLSIANLKEVLQQAVNDVIGGSQSGQTPVVERVHIIEARHMLESEAR